MTLKIAVIPVTPLQQNCTLMWCDETHAGVIIDPGNEVDTILDAVAQTGITVERILLTHGHFDHVGGAMDLAEHFGVPIIGPHKDDEFLTTAVAAAGKMYNLDGGRDIVGNGWVEDGDEIAFGNEHVRVIHAPGHTPGHVVFYNEAAKLAQVGDVLFQGSIGRTDFPRGDFDTLIRSITQNLWPLGGDVTFIPGHGPDSTFARERASNPFVGDAALS